MKSPNHLSIEEQHHIQSGAWFSRLSPALRDDILARAVVRRYADGAPLASRGGPADLYEIGLAWAGASLLAAAASGIVLGHALRRHRLAADVYPALPALKFGE